MELVTICLNHLVSLPSSLFSLKFWTPFIHFFPVQAINKNFSCRGKKTPQKNKTTKSLWFAQRNLAICCSSTLQSPFSQNATWLLRPISELHWKLDSPWCELPFSLRRSRRKWNISSWACQGKLGFLLTLKCSTSVLGSTPVPAQPIVQNNQSIRSNSASRFSWENSLLYFFTQLAD